MSERSKVIWQEGLFLRPQHFQQQDRYLEAYVESRAAGLRSHSWGLEELEISRDALEVGRLAIHRARGVFPDGTPFSMPDRDPLPPALEVSPDMRARNVFLALPLRRPGSLECDRNAGASGLTRQSVRSLELHDVTAESVMTALVEVGGLRTRLLAEGAPLEDFACIPLARILERAEARVSLDGTFMPTALRIKACPPLNEFLQQLHGMLNHHGDALERIVTGRSLGIADLQSFLRLQVFNRYGPLVQHLARLDVVHPEEFYRLLLMLAGDLSGLSEVRRPGALPIYQHEDLRASFEFLIKQVPVLMQGVLPNVVSIIVELKRQNAYVANITDLSLVDTADFYLAAKADLPPDELRRRIPQLITIAPSARLSHIVEMGLSGLKLTPLQQLPPQIPFHANYVYFQIVRGGPLWNEMRDSGAFGLYAGAIFPGLSLSMWAMRRSQP